MAAAAAVRRCLFTFVWVLSGLATGVRLGVTLAAPISPPSHEHSIFQILERPGVTINNASGGIVVFNAQTQQVIPQGVASDGGGSNFSTLAVLWIVFMYLIGGPLAFAGIRGWRYTIGAAIGLSSAVCTWAAFINTIPSQGVPDIVIASIVFGIFVLGFILGFFDFSRIAGITLLGIIGGLALGMRIVMFKNQLLVDSLAVDWAIIVVCGVGGGLFITWKQRVAINLCSASAGLFLIGLGVDLCLNRQEGMSRGLRFLFDRNTSHLADILSNGYTPPTSTKIILGASLALVPFLAFIQHKIFRDPFDRTPPEEDIDFDPSSVTSIQMNNDSSTIKHTLKKINLGSRFSQFSAA